ncbi:MAG: alpha/beta hydrolase [Flavobacteriales bacterium]|nr:alpha/beta hydrolase [Flavobacteriales bacterium]
MIETTTITANGLQQHLRLRKGGDRHILFIHGNGSDSAYWEELMKALPSDYSAAAPDLRGYGLTEAQPARAERSYGDYVDDLKALVDALGWERYHIAGHSLGGGMAWELLLADAARIESITMINPASPYGFGGTKTADGQLTFPDGAGSGGGIVNPDFVRLLQAGDRSDSEPTSPRNVMNTFYWAPPFVPDNVEALLDGLLRMKVGEQFYPGDSVPSEHFPFAAPGKFGQLNCGGPLSKQGIVERLGALPQKPPILWVRGAKDQIVSDQSMFDLAVHGAAGLVPGYPGEEVCPPQPMIAQTRHALRAYEAKGGRYTEVLMEDCAHSPYIENQDEFMQLFLQFLAA